MTNKERKRNKNDRFSQQERINVLGECKKWRETYNPEHQAYLVLRES